MANVLATPRFWKSKAILIKEEVTYGVDPTPTGLLNWFEARNVALTPIDAETVDRNIDLPYMGSAGKALVGSWAKLSFDILLAASGVAGTAPKWGPMMLALGFAETVAAGVSVTYNLASSGFKGLTAYVNVDGTLHKLLGCRGTVSAKLTAKGVPALSVELTALYTAPSAVAMPAIDRTGWTYDQAVNSTNTGKVTVNAVDLAFSSFDYAVGNNVARIDLPGPQVEVAITGRKPSAALTVLAPALGVFDPFALVQAGTVVDISNTHGSVAGNKVKSDLKARVIGADYDQVEEMVAYKLNLEPTPVAGNDEITITCL